MERLLSCFYSLMLRKSDTPLTTAALDCHFSSDWESQLYSDILKLFQNSMVDESVPIGCCRASRIVGRNTHQGLTAGRRTIQAYPPTLISSWGLLFIPRSRIHTFLPPFEQGPASRRWLLPGTSHDRERKYFRRRSRQIERGSPDLTWSNTKHYPPPPPISSTVPAFKYYSGDLPVPPNDFISRLRYLKRKSTMSHTQWNKLKGKPVTLD